VGIIFTNQQPQPLPWKSAQPQPLPELKFVPQPLPQQEIKRNTIMRSQITLLLSKILQRQFINILPSPLDGDFIKK
jgi:hypothetical protein